MTINTPSSSNPNVRQRLPKPSVPHRPTTTSSSVCGAASNDSPVACSPYALQPLACSPYYTVAPMPCSPWPAALITLQPLCPAARHLDLQPVTCKP